MRLLVRCRQCQRQYQAGDLQPGQWFRCHCGAEVAVGRPRGHDAAVVRCSSCGAPRDEGASACRHCGADFTIHETDRDTVCPSCLAHVSDQAQFCHHCGTPLVAELVAGEETESTCPVCGPERTLTSRRLTAEAITVLECETCAGLWLGLQTFQLLLKQEARQPKPATARRSIIGRPQTGPRYRRCVICGQLMVRKNLDEGKSGVIVDLCGSHGIWFDAEELSQLLAWMRSGGLEGVRGDVAKLRRSGDPVGKRQAQQKAEARRRAKAADGAASESSGTPVIGDFDPPQDDLLVDIGAAVLRALATLFHPRG